MFPASRGSHHPEPTPLPSRRNLGTEEEQGEAGKMEEEEEEEEGVRPWP